MIGFPVKFLFLKKKFISFICCKFSKEFLNKIFFLLIIFLSNKVLYKKVLLFRKLKNLNEIKKINKKVKKFLKIFLCKNCKKFLKNTKQKIHCNTHTDVKWCNHLLGITAKKNKLKIIKVSNIYSTLLNFLIFKIVNKFIKIKNM